MQEKGLLLVVSAPSGTGKTTLCRAMVRIFPNLHYSISYTTRPLRAGEETGKDYYFVSPEDFQKMIDQGYFAEWAEIYGYRYGTSQIILEKIRKDGNDVILDIDGQGARQLRDKSLEGIFIFILPPSVAELEHRLSRRQTEGKEAMAERLRKAKAEMAEAHWYDYIIVNDDLKKAEEQLKGIILSEHCRRDRMIETIHRVLEEK
jgi:guanylate kinase